MKPRRVIATIELSTELPSTELRRRLRKSPQGYCHLSAVSDSFASRVLGEVEQVHVNVVRAPRAASQRSPAARKSP